MLPTERRFLDLSDRQKYFLFMGFLETATPEQIRQYYIDSKIQMQIDDSTAANLKNLGYTEEQIRFMQSQLKLAGAE